MKHSAGITLLILYTLFQPADAILLCILWGFDNLASNTATSISSSKFNSVMSRTSSQSSLPVSCASSPVTIIDENVLVSHPLPSISRLQVGSSGILGHVTAVLVLVSPPPTVHYGSFGLHLEFKLCLSCLHIRPILTLPLSLSPGLSTKPLIQP